MEKSLKTFKIGMTVKKLLKAHKTFIITFISLFVFILLIQLIFGAPSLSFFFVNGYFSGVLLLLWCLTIVSHGIVKIVSGKGDGFDIYYAVKLLVVIIALLLMYFFMG